MTAIRPLRFRPAAPWLRRLPLLLAVLVAGACERAGLITGPDAAPDFSVGHAKPIRSHNPILFVHGYNSSGSTWNTMVGRFEQDGWKATELFAWTYDYHQSNATTASQIQLKIDSILVATGATRVDIVTHSMGALSSRYYLKYFSGTAPVDAWVSLGGPNHGTDWANGCGDVSCIEMRVGSAFLADLNSGDETPGPYRYGTWRSPCDLIVATWSVPLSGATNNQTTCLQHTQLETDAGVYKSVRDFVAASL